ncbi:MAG TPA: FadR/GntR family transcriptional regulator [Desulfatiglandales bacterium]|nr:FadR/GntR family transcriptional regulator [Desulfatiglandales bacterium]
MEKLNLKPVKKSHLSENIVEQIKNLIIRGDLKPSDKLPSERDLTKMFNVGRPTVREAIRTLRMMGLVEVHHGQKGTIIKNFAIDPYLESVRDQMSLMLEMKKTTIQQLTEVRGALDNCIALLSAERATKGHLKGMEDILKEMELCTNDTNAYLIKAIEFHKVMSLSTNNPIFFAIWSAFFDLIIKLYEELLDRIGGDVLKRLYLTNLEVFKAILIKDPIKIRAAMAHHLDLQNEILTLDRGESI